MTGARLDWANLCNAVMPDGQLADETCDRDAARAAQA